MCDDDEYCVMLDGDDWLRGEYVLDYLNSFMNTHNVDITYGRFREFVNNKNIPASWVLVDYPNHVKKNKSSVAILNSNISAIINQDNIYSTQFHPENSHEQGVELLKNFTNI